MSEKNIEKQIEKENNKKEIENIEHYLNKFTYLKSDLDELINKKNPITFLIGVKKIFGKINNYLKEISIFLNKSFNNFDIDDNKHSFLYDIGISNIYKEIIVDYAKKSKYFDPEKHIEIYSKFDKDFKHFIQKVISYLNERSEIKGDFYDLTQNDNYQKFLKLIIQVIKSKNFNTSNLKGDILIDESFKKGTKLKNLSGYSNESSFCNNLISFYFKNENNYSKKYEFLAKIFELFDIDKYINKDISYSKMNDIINLLSFNETNEYKKSQIEKLEERKEIENIIYNYEFNFENYIKVSDIAEKKEGQIKGYLWGYFKNSIKEKNFDIRFSNWVKHFTQNKYSKKQDWLEVKIDYKSNIEDISDISKSKEQSIEFLNTLENYKSLIIKLQESIFADIIKTHILRFLYDNLSVKKDKIDYIKLLLYFGLCENYYEYIKVYTFFEEYEAFEDNKQEKLKKINIFNNSVFVISLVIIGYFFSFILSFGIILLYIGNKFLRKNFYSESKYIRWHNGFRFLGTLTISLYAISFLMTNNYVSFDLKIGGKNINEFIYGEKTEKIVTYNGNEFLKDSSKFVTDILGTSK
ncbi:hypothetical protein [Candidatus Vampirococcus lugosii]|uniref:Uncharacterized protein n=1 Tax=Candidatus Vampirococcus lugosii TaxID=2789015 RepID=A0ABS5QMA1_9BACT|nr:hypothetical protein [Candidatus Vampirococcus lugosii]MBS8122204.1 hypothetical protein [Candidatus Vampirococcus lugosii]